MKVEGIRLDPHGSQSLPKRTTVEAFAPTGEQVDLFPGQRLNATVMSVNGRNALIELNGTPLTLAGLQGVQPGTELSVLVTQVAPRLLLDVAARPTKPQLQQPPLTLGQQVTAEVIEALANGNLLVDILGTPLEAETSSQFPAGAKLTARVERLRPQLILQVLPGVDHAGASDVASGLQQEALHVLRANISHHASSGESLQVLEHELTALIDHPQQGEVPPSIAKLQTFIKTLFPHETPPTAEHLAAFIRDGGLLYESKLFHAFAEHPQAFNAVAESDLKGLLLQALKDVEIAQDKKATATPELVDSVVHHLENIENQQAVNVLAQVKGEPYQLQIPFFTQQGITTAFLSIESEGQGNKEMGEGGKGETGKGYNILFMLDLDGFGRTRIDARIGEKSLWVAFYVDQPHSVSLLKEELPTFRETLQSFGYEEVLVMAKPLGQLSPEKREKFDALTVGVPASVRLLDVKA